MEITKELLETMGIKKGAKIDNLLPLIFKTKYEQDISEVDEITDVEISEFGELILKTKFTESVKEINGKEVPDDYRKIIIDNPSHIYVYKTAKLPDTVNGEKFEMDEEYIEFDFLTLPRELIKQLNKVNKLIDANREEWEEIFDLKDISITINDLSLNLDEIKVLGETNVSKYKPKMVNDSKELSDSEDTHTATAEAAAPPMDDSHETQID